MARRVLDGLEDLQKAFPRLVVLAWEQTEGRGQHGRRWCGSAGQGILASLVLPGVKRRLPSLIPLRVGLALAETVQTYILRPVRLKWPNDLFVGDAKLGGVLVESISRGNRDSAIVGFGVNHGRPPRVEAVSTTSIVRESAVPPTLARAAVETVHSVLSALDREQADPEIVEGARQLSYYEEGQEIECRTAEGSAVGRYRGLDERGFLLLETDAGVTAVPAGEVSSR